MDCIFCKIAAGEITSVKVYEDDRVFAFMDINPINEGHLLIIPKAHAATIHEITEADFKKALNPDGINLLQLNGKAANQVVPHLHVHIVPRWFGDGVTVSQWQLVAGDMEKIEGLAERIRGEMGNSE